MKLCECGCGQAVKGKNSRFSWGHHARVNPPLKGRHLSVETKSKISLSKKGRHLTEEHKLKISQSMKEKGGHPIGCLCPFCMAKRGSLVRKPCSEETKKKISEARTGMKLSKETKKKLSKSHKGKKYPKELYPNWGFSGKHHTEILKESMRGDKNPSKRPEVRKKIRQWWRNPKFRNKIVKAQRLGLLIKPNKPEQKLIDLIQRNNFLFIYTGDGKIAIEGFCPDFTDDDGNKRIIEVFGEYWHKLPEVVERDRKRLQVYSKYGYRTLIIWEHELENLGAEEKIRGFVDG